MQSLYLNNGKIVRNGATLFCWSGTHDDRNNI